MLFRTEDKPEYDQLLKQRNLFLRMFHQMAASGKQVIPFVGISDPYSITVDTFNGRTWELNAVALMERVD